LVRQAEILAEPENDGIGHPLALPLVKRSSNPPTRFSVKSYPNKALRLFANGLASLQRLSLQRTTSPAESGRQGQ
jgi:hypothetical protein